MHIARMKTNTQKTVWEYKDFCAAKILHLQFRTSCLRNV